MHYFSVCSKRTIPTTEGEKHLVNKVGFIQVSESGSWHLCLYQQPDVQFKIFPSKDQSLPVIEA